MTEDLKYYDNTNKNNESVADDYICSKTHKIIIFFLLFKTFLVFFFPLTNFICVWNS